MKQTKKALFTSVIALILCFSMLIGTTFAWFTDSVESAMNQIIAGNLDVNLYWSTDAQNWAPVKANTNVFTDSRWEPGHTEVVYLKIVNEGTLALKYQLGINVAGETGSVNVLGEEFKLSEYIKFGVVDGVEKSTRDQTIAAAEAAGVTALKQPYNSGTQKLPAKSDDPNNTDHEQIVTLVVYMPTSVGNEANYAKGEKEPKINLGIRLMATQVEAEFDSFGDDYDKDSTWPPATIHFSETVDVPAVGALAESVTIGQTSYIHAILPAGFVAGNTTLELKIDSMERQANVTLEPGATAQSYNVHIEGVNATNGQAAIITVPGMLPSGLSELKVELYHVENGVAVKMTRVDAAEQAKNHNEFHYDSATGGVIMALASFSEVVAVVNPVKEGEILINETVTTEVDKETVDQTTGELKQSMTIAVAPATGDNTTGDETTAPAETVSAVVPEGVKLAEDATSLTLDVTTIPAEESQANIVLEEGEISNAIDVHIEGVAEDNTVPMIITLPNVLPKGLNQGNVKLFHVEDGNTVQMTEVSDPKNHNEFYYNAATGDVVMALKSFSEVAVVANESNPWQGGISFDWYTNPEKIQIDAQGNRTYFINSADELAGFGAKVDGGYSVKEGETVRWVTVEADNFDNQTVKLTRDIILNQHDHVGNNPNQFDPIGWGYDNASYNRDGAAGKVFMGTFDGDGHAIHGLYQNGWDLEAKTKTDYTYTNCGFGLFASVKDATIKNLTLKHSNVVVECVEAGILVGLAQGNCTFENIYIYHASIANYQRPAGGVVGEVSPGFKDGVAQASTMNFNNVHVGSSVTVGTLWGDFDAPVGGVIGAYWDDAGMTRINMTHVDVSCKLDVYNDVTSAYQWYAYRRAGMLIGNTDRAETINGRTVASTKLSNGESYLTCTGCIVIYDYTWTDYAYCEFTNTNNPGKNYPWVRVQPSQYNSAYSNPRYGHPIDAAGNSVDDDLHIHDADDDCTVILKFNQLYGGGQGVYGQPTHEGVKEGKFTITFIGGDGHVEDVWYITADEMAAGNQTIKQLADNDIDNKHQIPAVTNGNKTLLAWEDANGTVYAKNTNGTWTYPTAINSANLVDIVLYPEWSNEYNVYFLDHDGKVLHYETFETGKDHALDTTAIANALASVQRQVDYTGTVIQATWDKNINNLGFASATDDIVVKVVLKISSDSITLEPVYNADTGVLTHYKVVGVNNSADNKSISIPTYVGNVPVNEIASGAFDGFNDLTAVRIPSTMTTLENGIFPGSLGFISWFDNRQTVTIYYEGTKEQWKELVKTAHDNWADTLGDGSRIFFLEKTEKGREIVDLDAGFIELYKSGSTYSWIEHNHPHLKTAPSDCTNKSHYKNFTDYDAAGRPDRNYWLDDSGNSIVNDDGSAKNPTATTTTTP